MAVTDTVALRALGIADLAAAQRLSDEVGWNQVEADWRIFVELGHLFGVVGSGDAVLGTAATLPLGPEFGWISMVIVTRALRRRGIGRRLVLSCVEDLARQGLVPGLDATPAGREVYGRLGFRDGWPIVRLIRPGEGLGAHPEMPMPGAMRSATAADLDAIAALDQRAFGTERRGVLGRLIERSPGLALVAWQPGAAAFMLGRRGRNATHIGPVVASDPAIALGMLDYAVARAPGPIVLDFVDLRPGLRAALDARGFVEQRRFVRMFYRQDQPYGDAGFALAIAGPELG